MLMVLSTSLCYNLSAQTPTDTTHVSKYMYCELVGFPKLLSNKVTISVDYGEETEFFQDKRIRDEQTGKIKTFNSMIDALNFMGKDGWEFVQAYIGALYGHQTECHWILKKRIK